MCAYTRPPSEVINKALASVTEPLDFFLQHGVFDPSIGLKNAARASWSPDDDEVHAFALQRVVRRLASEQGRPMITMRPFYRTFEWVPDPNSLRGRLCKRRFPTRKWYAGTINFPKRRYLQGHANFLTLMADGKLVHFIERKTRWQFNFSDEALFSKAYNLILTDPNMRRARRVPEE